MIPAARAGHHRDSDASLHQRIGVKLFAIIGFTPYYWQLLAIIAIIGYYWLLFFLQKFLYYWLLLRQAPSLIIAIIGYYWLLFFCKSFHIIGYYCDRLHH